jgi:ATP-dependent exoDNAse (exonuclease V) alpha subunit
MRSIELTARYTGERFHFDNPDGTRVIIGQALLSPGSKELIKDDDIDVDEPITVKGEADDSELQPNGTYRFFGTWNSYFNRRQQRREKQFHFRTFVPHIPHDREGVINYLINAGKGNGVGPSKARQMTDAFGVDSVLDVCREDPNRIASQFGITQHKAESFSQKLNEQKSTERATLEVDQLLTGRGFARTMIRRVIKAWGNRAAEQIKDDPYSLMQFRGVGFGLTDKLWTSLGKDPAAIDRQALCLWYGIASDQAGHTWYPAKQAVQRLHQSIGSANVDYRAAIIRGREYGQISENHYGAIATIRSSGVDGSIDEEGDTLWIAEGKYAAAERYVADAIARAMNETTRQSFATRYEDFERIEHRVLRHATCQRCRRQLTASLVHVLDGLPYGPTCIGYVDPSNQSEIYSLAEWLEANPEVLRFIEQQPSGLIKLPEVSLWPEPNSIEGISEHQRSEVAKAMTARIGLLGGSPGTGKTFTLAAIIKAIHRSGRVGLHEIGIGAPTGKAAVRLTESLNAAGVPIRARTWHSLLGVGSSDPTDGDNTEFKHCENLKWPFKIIFGDESSMPPINIMAAIFKARAAGTHMMFVGDVNQLPPVGNGAPFRDMIAANLPYGELREIRRNSGGIVEACAKIRDEQPWTDDCDRTDVRDPLATNLTISGDRSPKQQIERLLESLHHLKSDKIDPIWDCQVLTAVNQRSELSRSAINKLLQEELNPNPAVKGTPFRVGDKVVCLKNGFYKSIFAIDPNSEEIDSEDGEVYIANGELGEIDAIEDKHFTVRLQSPDRLIQVFRGKPSKGDDDDKESTASGCSWDLGYALSVHKFQGSEQKYVFVMLDNYAGARMVCDRSWIYTAISRAQLECHLIGTEDTANRFCRVQKMDGRKTFLANRIHLESFEQQMAGAVL